jgi:hypothetical protein
VVWANICVLLLCSTVTVPGQDPHAHPPNVGRAVYAVHIQCGFLSLAHLVTGGLSMMDSAALMALVNWWGDHNDDVGHRHDPWSPHQWHVDFQDGVSRQVEGLHRGCYRPSTPRCSCRPEGQEDDGRSLWVAHNSLRHLSGGC